MQAVSKCPGTARLVSNYIKLFCVCLSVLAKNFLWHWEAVEGPVDKLKNKMTSKINTTAKMKTTSKMKTT